MGHTYIKYFLSYLLISIVLIAGFFLIIKNQLTTRYFNQLCQETQQKLDSLATQLDDDLLYLSQVDSSVKENIDIILSRYYTAGWSNYQTYHELQKYAASNKLINSVVYVAKQSDTVISTKLPIQYHDSIFYFEARGRVLSFDPTPYYGASSGQLIYLCGQEQEYLIYFPPTQTASNYLYFYVLNYRDIEQQIANITSLELPAVAFVNSDKQIAIGVNSNLLSSYIEESTLDRGISELNDSTSLCVSTGINNGYSIVALISNDLLLDQINVAFATSYRALLLLAILGFLMILFAMRITYLPLHKLTKKIVSEPTTNTSYLEQLDLAFSEAEEYNQILKDKLDKYRLSMKKSLFDSCINPDYFNKDLPNPNIDQFFDADLNSKIFVIYIETRSRNFSHSELHKFFLEMLPGNDSCIVLNTDHSHAVFLINYIGTEPNKKEVLLELLHNLHDDHGYLCAISNGTSSPMDIPSLYESVMVASKYLPQESVIDYNSLAPSSASFTYPHEKLNRLAELLNEYNFTEVKLLIDELFQIINDTNTADYNFPDFFIRCILVDMLSIIINAINQSGIKFKAYSELYFETIDLCRSCSSEENSEVILKNTRQLISFYEHEVTDKTISPSQIRQLIETSCYDPDFSIAIMANQFQISIAYMSYLVKMKLNMNFSEYLWNLRLEKAKELLLSTDMSIDEISLTVGYLNTSSFRRKFKSETGLTPTQFRTQK